MALVTDPIDLLLDGDGDIVVGPDLVFSKGIEAVAQSARIRLLSFKGEWFADLEDGVPYYQNILGQKFNQTHVRDAFRDALLGTADVAEIVSLVTEFNRGTRLLSVSWELLTVFGDTVSDALDLEV
jgi:hypothetical protein